MAKQTLGKLAADAFGMLDLPALPRDVLDGYRALPDLTGIVSDAMDELGIVGAIPSAVLRPTDPKARLVGRALTVRNIAPGVAVPDKVKAGVSGLGEIEAHNLAEPGDVLVVQGVDQVSNLGGISATIGRRRGEIGAIVDGGARDVDHSRGIGYPIWSKSVSPITGKSRPPPSTSQSQSAASPCIPAISCLPTKLASASCRPRAPPRCCSYQRYFHAIAMTIIAATISRPICNARLLAKPVLF